MLNDAEVRELIEDLLRFLPDPVHVHNNDYDLVKEIGTRARAYLASFGDEPEEMPIFLQLAHERGANTSYDDKE